MNVRKMAAKDKEPPTAPAGASEGDKKKARAWFKKAEDCRERREYDYAIECYIQGLGLWPDAVEEGHMPLRAVSIQRQQTGGKKPGMFESMKTSVTGKDTTKAMLNAEQLLAKDPANASFVDALLKNANKAGYNEVVKWAAPLAFDSMKRDKKPDKGRFKNFRSVLVETSERASAQGDVPLSVWLLEQALNSLEYMLARMPGDEDLRIEQREMAGRLAIEKGKYETADDFRDSIRDADQQKHLHDAERLRQSDETYDSLLTAVRKAYEEEPVASHRINSYVDALLKREEKEYEDQAIAVLLKAAEDTRSYNYKQRADDIRLRQLSRQTRQLIEKARQSGSEEDKQQARLARAEQAQAEMEIYQERVAKYPTDLRLKFKLGVTFFNAGRYDDAIPVLQVAQNEPRSRTRSQMLIGRAFLEKGSPAQAVEVLKDLLDGAELTDDVLKEATYWLGRALEADGRGEDAKAAYGKLLRQDYNYAGGDARRRMEALK